MLNPHDGLRIFPSAPGSGGSVQAGQPFPPNTFHSVRRIHTAPSLRKVQRMAFALKRICTSRLSLATDVFPGKLSRVVMVAGSDAARGMADLP
jgi:hypothetical protein